jgi:plasmid replication initiation protein
VELEKQEHNIFNKPSILCNLSHTLDIGVNELKTYNYVLRTLFKQNIANNTDNKVKTSYTEIAHNIFDRKDYKVSSTEINKYLNTLKSTSVIFKNWEHNRNDWYDELNSNLISAYRYDTRLSDDLEIEVSNMLLEFILNNKETFAKLDLLEIKSLKSRHTLKLYEVFKDYSYQFNLKLSLKQVRQLLNIPDDKYPQASILNRNIINKSIKEINSKTYLDIEYSYKRASKGVEAFYIFQIRDINRFSFNGFKATYIELFKYKNIICNSKYVLEELEENKTLWLHKESGKTVTTDKAKEIWEHLFHEVNYNTLSFCENHNVDVVDFQTVYDKLKNRKQKNKVVQMEDGTEIHLHPNQGQLDL